MISALGSAVSSEAVGVCLGRFPFLCDPGHDWRALALYFSRTCLIPISVQRSVSSVGWWTR